MASESKNCRLSVAVLVRDAADALRFTLASMRGIADETVVVDTGSRDQSVEVAREFGARVFDFTWNDDFAAARNFALRQVSGDWVLWLDAGETFNGPEAVELRKFIDTDADANCAYVLPIRLPPADSQAESEQVAQVRVVPHKPTVAFAGRVRESLHESLRSCGIRIAAAPFVIWRDARDLDVRIKKQKAHRNIRLAEQEQRERGFSARLWNCLGDGLQTLGENHRAAECFRQGRSIAERGTPDQLESFYGLLTSLEPSLNSTASSAKNVTAIGNPESGTTTRSRSENSEISPEEIRQAQIAICMQALEVFPLDAQLFCALAGYLYVQGHPQLALNAYRTAYQFGQVEPSVWHVADIRDIAAVCSSVVLQLQQRQEEAVQFLEEVLLENSESRRVRRHLIELHVSAARRDAALTHVGAMPKNTPHKEALRSAVRGACYAVEKNWIAAKAYLQTAYGHGCRDALCLKWLSITLLAVGENDAARPILEQWQTAEPRNSEASKLLEKLAAKSPVSIPDRQIRVDQPVSKFHGTSVALNFGQATTMPRPLDR